MFRSSGAAVKRCEIRARCSAELLRSALRLQHVGCDNHGMPDDQPLERIELHMQRGNELLTRIDAHLERGIADFSPEHLACGAEFEARIAEHIARCEQVIAADGKAYEEWRFSMRQDSLRSERILGEISQSMRQLGDKFDRLDDRSDIRADRLSDLVADVRAEGLAYREALWKILDKLSEILDKLSGDDGSAPATG
jgi:hypothetical protein